MSKVLVVEDDPATANVVKEYLEMSGHSVDLVNNASDALEFIKSYFYNIILLDWHLSDSLTGVDVLKEFRANGGVAPVLMMTSRGNISDKEVGFGAGADDYLQKPFLGKELILRVEALLRRAPCMPSNLIQVGRLKLDTVKHTAFVDEAELSLRPKEYALLEHFMRHPGYVFSPAALINAVWPSEDNPSETALRVTIKRLRQCLLGFLGDDPIETVHGMGYKLRG